MATEANNPINLVQDVLAGGVLNTAFPPANYEAGTYLFLRDVGGAWMRGVSSVGVPMWVALGSVGDIGAAAGAVGPFFDVTAASQTDKALKYGDTLSFSYVAQGTGSVMGLSGMVDILPTVAGIDVRVYKNGVVLAASAKITFGLAGNAYQNTQFARGLYTFVAGDRLDLRYTNLATGNTPKFVGNILLG